MQVCKRVQALEDGKLEETLCRLADSLCYAWLQLPLCLKLPHQQHHQQG